MTRTAISPRLATRTLLNTGGKTTARTELLSILAQTVGRAPSRIAAAGPGSGGTTTERARLSRLSAYGTTARRATADGTAASSAVGTPTPAFESSPRPDPTSTSPSEVRSRAVGSRTERWLPTHTPGTEPIRTVPA